MFKGEKGQYMLIARRSSVDCFALTQPFMRREACMGKMGNMGDLS